MASSVVLPHSLSPGDIYYLADNSMIVCVSQSPNPGAGAATASGHHHHHYKARGPPSQHGVWATHSVPLGMPADLVPGYYPAEYGALGHHAPTAVTMAALQAPESASALHQVPLFSNGYMFPTTYMMPIQDQDTMMLSIQDTVDQQQQQQYAYTYAYPQHPVMPTHQPYNMYPAQHHHHHQQQSPPGALDGSVGVYTPVSNAATVYMSHEGMPGTSDHHQHLQQHQAQQQQQQQQSPGDSGADGKSDHHQQQQQQQQQQQRRPKQQNTNQALEQINKLMLKLGVDEQTTADERQERIRRYTDIALTIPIVWSYVCTLSELKHEAELSKVYGFLHHLAQCSVSPDEWTQAMREKSCVFSVVDGRLRQKVCPILRVQGRSPEKIETLCEDIKQKPSQRYRVQAKHVLEQLHEFFCSFLPAELPQLSPPEQLVVDHASVLVIYSDTDSFDKVNSLLHKLAFTKLCLGPDAPESDAAAAASPQPASDDPVDAAKRKWEAQLRPCSCARPLSLYAVPGKWQAYPLVADSQWELTRADTAMSTTLSIKSPVAAPQNHSLDPTTVAAAASNATVSEAVGKADCPAPALTSGAEAAAAMAHYTGPPILTTHDVPYQLCGLMESNGLGSAPPPQPPPQTRPFKPHQHYQNQHHQHPHHHPQGFASYSMPSHRRHTSERQTTVPPRFARNVGQASAYHEHEGASNASAAVASASTVAAPTPQINRPLPQPHQPHQEFRSSAPPPRSSIGRGGGRMGYGRGGSSRGGRDAGRDYHHNHAPQGPPEFRLKDNDFPEISAEVAPSTPGIAITTPVHSAGSAASVTAPAPVPVHVASIATPPDLSESPLEYTANGSITGGGGSEVQHGSGGGATGTSYAAALKKSAPPGTKVATASAAAISLGDAVDEPSSPTSPSPGAVATGVRRAVASAAQAVSSAETSDTSDWDSASGPDAAAAAAARVGYRGNSGGAKASAAPQQRASANGSVASNRGGARQSGSRNASGSNV